jgi:hypothetical protein
MRLAEPSAVRRGLNRLREWGRGSDASDTETQALEARATRGEHAAMVALISLQHADGSWDLSDDLSHIIRQDREALEAAIRDAAGDATEIRKAWATALAFVWLHERAASFEGEWRLAADKAWGWLSRVHATPADGGEWPAAAQRMLSTVTR